MKVVQKLFLLGSCAASALGEQTNPVSSVLSLLDELTAKITKEGEVEAKAYNEYLEWCDDVSKNNEFSTKTATMQKAKLEAKINELAGSISVSDTKIADIAAGIATSEQELKNATQIREAAEADFKSNDAELMDVVDTLERAIGVLTKEMAKNPAALAQVDTTNMASFVQALGAVLDAAAFSSSDQKKLLGLVQQQQAAQDDEAEPGAPAAAAYKSKSGSIVDVLEDLKEKAEGQLADLRKAEVNTKHNYEMLKQSLEDEAGAGSKDLADAKATKAAAQEAKAIAESDLAVATKDLENGKNDLVTARATCMQVAADHEATVASRSAELTAIAQATKVLKATSSGAVSQTYSFLQVASASLAGSRLQTRADLAKSEVVTLVKQLAQKNNSPELAQLASRLAAVVRFGAGGGEEPFAKVKGLIVDMISKLKKEAGSEATEKAYCDEQLAKTEAKKGELEEDLAKLTTKIDQATARSATLKEEVKELESELAALAREQAEMDKIRMESKADYEAAKADLVLGLDGVRKATGTLRAYYGNNGAALVQDSAGLGAAMQQPAMPEQHSMAQGAGASIIGILETIESDFATNLAKEETSESDAQSEYEKVTMENKVTRTMKEQDAKYTNSELKNLAKSLSEFSSDWQSANAEQSALLEYYAQIKGRCIAKPESYEERARRREAEIQGLKQALSVLEDETALVQRAGAGRRFRGSALVAR